MSFNRNSVAFLLAIWRKKSFEVSKTSEDWTFGGFPTLSNFTLPAIGSISTFGLENAGFLGNGLGLQFNPLNALNQNGNTPNAYAVVHIMDEEGNVLETHEQFMEHGANSYQKLSLDLEVAHKDAAYAAVFVANESPTDVYFDDLELKHTRLVWQENAYYPFGMGIKPLDYEPEGSSKFKYNGKEHEEATGLIEFEARNHDPMIGRFHGVDPKADEFTFQSSYAYANNNPSTYFEVRGENAGDPNDPNDLQKALLKAATSEKVVKKVKETNEKVSGMVEFSGSGRLAGANAKLTTPLFAFNGELSVGKADVKVKNGEDPVVEVKVAEVELSLEVPGLGLKSVDEYSAYSSEFNLTEHTFSSSSTAISIESKNVFEIGGGYGPLSGSVKVDLDKANEVSLLDDFVNVVGAFFSSVLDDASKGTTSGTEYRAPIDMD